MLDFECSRAVTVLRSLTQGRAKKSVIPITLQDTLAAISVLLDTESCSRLSGTAEYKQWGRDDPMGSPKHVRTVHFSVDHQTGAWSEEIVPSGEGRRYSRESGYEYVDNGKPIDYMPEVRELPTLVKILTPTRFEIWGRPGDKWKVSGAERIEHGYLLHFARDTSPAVAELFVSDLFALPVRWTETHTLGDGRQAKSEIEIKGIHVPEEWKRRVGMDSSVQGEDRISAMVENR